MGDGKNANNDKKLTESVILALLSRNSIDHRKYKKKSQKCIKSRFTIHRTNSWIDSSVLEDIRFTRDQMWRWQIGIGFKTSTIGISNSTILVFFVFFTSSVTRTEII